MKEIKSVRVRKRNIKSGVLDIKVILYEDRNIFSSDDRVLVGYNNDRPVWIESKYSKSGIYKDFNDEQFILHFINTNSKIDGGGSEYEIIQDPWELKVPIWRNYGFDPYYLNNGSEVYISWNNPETFEEEGGIKYSTSQGSEIDYDPKFLPEVKSKNIIKSVSIINKEDSKILTINKNSEFEYDSKNLYEYSNTDDKTILEIIITKWKNKIPNYDLELCSPDNESCYILPYKSPLNPIIKETESVTTAVNENPKEIITVILPESIKVKIDTTFKIFIGRNNELNLDEITDLSDEYIEEPFEGSEEAPLDLIEIGSTFDNVQEDSLDNSYNPSNITPGKIVSLPTKYSHTNEQGFNLLNSQWIGDLITSANSHIGHPTYDIAGTERGALGCASAVSMIFYRAFGVHMKTGKEVKEIPKSIGDFGSKGTGELAGWFSNVNLYVKIPWKDAQPGDILNTSRSSKAGHIGIVIDSKNNDGSWNVISNSSKGFEGGGGGAIKLNYSVNKWQSVTNRNPSGTAAYRYIGPILTLSQPV